MLEEYRKHLKFSCNKDFEIPNITILYSLYIIQYGITLLQK